MPFVALIIFVGILAFLTSLILNFLYLSVKKYFPKRKRTIIPEYEPPQNLKPAVVGIVVNGKINSRSWAATIADLVIRDHIRIHKEKPTFWTRFSDINIGLVVAFSIPFILALISGIVSGYWPVLLILITTLIPISFISYFIWKFVNINSHCIELLNKSILEEDSEELEDYERKFLKILFKDGFLRKLSFKTLRQSGNKGHKIFSEIQERIQVLRRELYEKTVANFEFYEKPQIKNIMKARRIRKTLLIISLVGLAVTFFLIYPLDTLLEHFILFETITKYFLLLFFLIGCILCSLLFIYNTRIYPQLNKTTSVLREKWLGFKLYLETAERYRMQNLTPETFEKYLPYAIIFGVEKKWARAFENFGLPVPSWCSGLGIYADVLTSPYL